MRKLIGTTVMAFAMATPAFATPVVTPPIIPVFGCTSAYVVVEGDTLWDLADLKLNNPALWSWLVEQNPILQEEGRRSVRDDGKEIVRINPGEKLYCLEDVGINRPNSLPVAGSPTTANPPSLAPVAPEKNFLNFLGDWWWLLAFVALGLLAWLIYRESRKDPVYSGPPQVNGGVNSVEQARQHFTTRGRENNFTVLSVIPGTIHGVMNVRYGDGSERPRSLNGERAYQATVRREDGQIEDIYMLQACGNDLRFGGVSRYIPGPNFRFVPDVADRPVEVASAQAASAADTSMPADLKKPELKIELKPAEGEGGTSMIRVSGAPTEDMVISVTDESVTVRFHPKR